MEKKTALITGASSGIGKSMAMLHASHGGDLVIVARSEEKLMKLKETIEEKFNTSVKVIVQDLSEHDAAMKIYVEVKESEIHIDYLVNNAGFGGRGYFHERDWQLDEKMIQVNIMTLTHLTRLFLPEFIERNEGKILNTSSAAAVMPGPLQAVYYASKAFVLSFSNALSEELRETNITVTALMPGATESNFGKTSGMDKTALFKKTTSPDIVALVGYNAMLEGKLEAVVGISKLLLKLTKLTPKKILLKYIMKKQSLN